MKYLSYPWQQMDETIDNQFMQQRFYIIRDGQAVAYHYKPSKEPLENVPVTRPFVMGGFHCAIRQPTLKSLNNVWGNL